MDMRSLRISGQGFSPQSIGGSWVDVQAEINSINGSKYRSIKSIVGLFESLNIDVLAHPYKNTPLPKTTLQLRRVIRVFFFQNALNHERGNAFC
jgi:hypothetical protein